MSQKVSLQSCSCLFSAEGGGGGGSLGRPCPSGGDVIAALTTESCTGGGNRQALKKHLMRR